MILLLLSVPLYLLFLTFSLHGLHRERRALEDRLAEQTEAVCRNFDYELTRLENISLNIQNSATIREYNYNAAEVSLGTKRAIINEIASLSNTNDFVSEIVVCLKSSQSAYSSTGLYDLNSLVPGVYPFSSWSGAQFTYDISTIREPVWRKKEHIIDRGEYLTLIYPIPVQNRYPYAVILYLISAQNFESRILPEFDWDVSVEVFSEQGECIFSSAALPLPEPDFQYGEGQMFPVSDGRGRRYMGVYAVSPKNGFRFFAAVPESELFATLPSPAIFWGLQTLALLLSLAAAPIAAWWIDLPVKRTVSRIADLYQLSGKGNRSLPHLVSLLEQNRRELFGLRQSLGCYTRTAADYFYSEILHGHFADPATVNAMSENAGIRFECPFYFIVRMQISQEDAPISNTDVLKRMEDGRAKWLETGYECHPRDSFLPGVMFLLFGAQSSDSAVLERDLLRMREMLSILLERGILFGVGRICRGFSGIDQSLLDSSSVMRYQCIYGSDTVLMPGLLSSTHIQPKFYPDNLLHQLENALRSADRVKIRDAMQQLVSHLQSTAYSPEVVSCILSDVIHTIAKTAPGLFPDPEGRSGGISGELLRLRTIEEIQQAVLKASAALEDPRPPAEKASVGIDQVYRYINEHYCDYDFSVQRMSEYFSVSPSNMAHIFKRNTNGTIIEYVNKLRMERASELLLTSDLTLKAIVKSIGFSDTSTFIKRFRSYYGMTPGQFKEKHRDVSLENNL